MSLAAVAIAGLVLLAASACGGGDGEETSQGAPAAESLPADPEPAPPAVPDPTPPPTPSPAPTAEEAPAEASPEPVASSVPTSEPAGTIVFASALEAEVEDMYRLDLASGEIVQLTDDPSRDLSPSPSQHGERIVFHRSPPELGEIWIMDPDGGEETLLVEDGNRPALSPDGTRIAFLRRTDPQTVAQTVFVMDSDGSNVIQLTDDTAIAGRPSWSPDGQRLAFSYGILEDCCTTEAPPQVYVMNADGSDLAQLTNLDGLFGAGDVAWSPSGDVLAFHSDAFGGLDVITLVDVDGTDPRPLLQDVATPEGELTSGVSPSWSPDGQFIVFEALDDLYIASSDGTWLRRVTDTPTGGTDPAWAASSVE